MRSRYRILEPHGTYFITSTIVEWLPVFTTSACGDILVNSLLHGREHKQLQIHAWVVMGEPLSRHPLRPRFVRHPG